MTYEEMRALFPSARTFAYLNHAGASPIAQPVADAVASVTADLLSGDIGAAFPHHLKRQEELRAAFGRMMNVPSSSLAFVRNTSHGIAIAAQAIPFRPGDVVVVAANEYPANIYPWMAQANRGVRVRLVPPRENGYVAEEDLIAACEAEGANTRALAVSWVQWGTGQRMDVARLGAFCRARDIYFAVDVVQGLGALRFDAAAAHADFVAAGCHKWLMAPAGLGVLHIRPEVMPTLLPTNIGWNSVTDPIDWEREHFDELKPTADRFEEGSPAILATAGLHGSVTLLEAVGFDAVERRVLEIAEGLREMLAARGCQVISPNGPGQRSGIVSFRHPRLSNEAVLEALTARSVLAAVRCGNVRLSPHVYNTDADIAAAAQALP